MSSRARPAGADGRVDQPALTQSLAVLNSQRGVHAIARCSPFALPDGVAPRRADPIEIAVDAVLPTELAGPCGFVARRLGERTREHAASGGFEHLHQPIIGVKWGLAWQHLEIPATGDEPV